MKAFLLAAGLGARLRPLTDTVPKCMVRIGDRTLLDIWLDQLAAVGVDEVLVNLHHLADVVSSHVAQREGGPRVELVMEPELLGSAGTLFANQGWVADEPRFLVLNADNLTDFDLRKLVQAHDRTGAEATVALFRAPRPRECGIAEVADGVITAFTEKPEHPTSDLANAGMYVFSPGLVAELVGSGVTDIGAHLLPRLVGRAHAVDIGEAYFMDIGTPEALQEARRGLPARTAS